MTVRGPSIGILGTYEDVTERWEAEQALQASQKMLRLVIDNIPQAVFWKDRSSMYLGCNTAFALDAGVGSVEEIAGKSDFDLAWTDEQAAAFVADDQQVMRSNQARFHILEQQSRRMTSWPGWTRTRSR